MQSSHFISTTILAVENGIKHQYCKCSVPIWSVINTVVRASKSMPAIWHELLCSSETARELRLLQM